MHFAVNFQPRGAFLNQRQGAAHLGGAVLQAAAKVGMRQQGGFGRNAKAAHFFGRHDGDLGQLLGGWVQIDVGIDQKQLPIGQQQAVHAGIGAHARAVANDLIDINQMGVGAAPGAANHAVHIAFVQQHGADQRQTPAHVDLGQLSRDALARGHAVVGLPKVAVTRVVLDIDHLVVHTFAQAQAKTLNALGNHGGSTDQGGLGQALVDHNLHRPQHAFVFALGVGHALFAGAFGGRKNGAHGGARGVDKTLQALTVGVHVGDGAQGHTTVGGGLGHGRGDLHHQARVKGLGNQILWAKRQLLARIGRGHHIALLGLGQLGNGVNGGNLHFVGDGGCTRIQGPAKNVGEAQNVVDLVVIVGAAGGHDGVVAHGLDFFGGNFGCGVGQRQDQRLGRHALDHLGLEHTTG